MLSSARRGLFALRPLQLVARSSFPEIHQSSLSKVCTRQSQLRGTTQRALFSTAWRSQQAAVAEERESSAHEDELTTFKQLAERGLVDEKVINTILHMNIHTMTDVQRLTLNHCLDGSDVIGQARTGTGKTLAFLMPIVQRILKDPNLKSPSRGFRSSARADDIRALIISPTRELAEQIAVEAKKIVYGTGVVVQTAVGGTQKSYHLRDMQRNGCHILVGTPGRVLDILRDPTSGVSLDNIETFVLDEADRLLDIGFAPDIADMQSFMPNREVKPRQTLMFSATVPKSVVSLVRTTLRPDFKFIRTVDPDEAPTHTQVPQKVVFAKGLQNQMPMILEIAQQAIDAHKQDPDNNMPFKAIVYFGSTNEVGLAYEIFEKMREPNSKSMYDRHPLNPCKLFRMSSRLEQRQRTRESDGFRNAESAILFSSDVTARGMDFPNVSHVIQVGQPKSPDDYVHRIGRTGRAGKAGQGWLIACGDEKRDIYNKFQRTGIKLEPTELITADLDMTQGAQVPAHIARLLQMVESGVRGVPMSTKAAVYQSLLGVLLQQTPDRPRQAQVDMMNELSKYGWGLQEPPTLSRSLVEKLGFGRCQGFNFSEGSPRGGSRGFGDAGSMSGRRNSFNDRDPFGQGLDSGKGVFEAGERRGGFQNNDRRTGFGGERRSSFGGERRTGYGGERSTGFGGGERRSGFGGERSTGFGRERGNGFGGERRTGFGNDRSRRSEDSDRPRSAFDGGRDRF